jgi:enamine deaminase RidA (YjgF/YER057c/UK114 family)
MSNIEKNLQAKGFTLPTNNQPVANYVPYYQVGKLVYVSGQTCKWNGILQFTGAVGDKISVEEGYKAAELCALNLLLQVKMACNNDLDRLTACINMTVFVQTAAHFTQHPRIANGASNLMDHAMGKQGKHSRSAVGVYTLPGDASVEIAAIFAID